LKPLHPIGESQAAKDDRQEAKDRSFPLTLDDVQQYMADKTGYIIDVPNEEKYMQIGTGWLKGDGATDAEMKFWTAWEASLRGTSLMLDRIGGKLDQIIQKAGLLKNSVEEPQS
jgi:hypothetical protein